MLLLENRERMRAHADELDLYRYLPIFMIVTHVVSVSSFVDYCKKRWLAEKVQWWIHLNFPT